MAVRRSPRQADRTGPAPWRAWALVYDHDCGLCRVVAALVLVADRRARLMPVPLQDPRTRALLAPLAPPVRPRSWHLVAPDGRVASGGAAVPELCRLLPGFGGLGRLSGAAPDMTERVYARAVGHRDRVARVVPERVSRGARRIIGRRLGQA
jgi:predicted DCC family thiol-disulfide oxidoreductase YuxK